MMVVGATQILLLIIESEGEENEQNVQTSCEYISLTDLFLRPVDCQMSLHRVHIDLRIQHSTVGTELKHTRVYNMYQR